MTYLWISFVSPGHTVKASLPMSHSAALFWGVPAVAKRVGFDTVFNVFNIWVLLAVGFKPHGPALVGEAVTTGAPVTGVPAVGEAVGEAVGDSVKKTVGDGGVGAGRYHFDDEKWEL